MPLLLRDISKYFTATLVTIIQRIFYVPLFRWFMPVNILLAFTFGLLFGWIVVKVTRAPAKLRGLILGCCSAGNQVYSSTFSLKLLEIPLQFVDKHSAEPSSTLSHLFTQVAVTKQKKH